VREFEEDAVRAFVHSSFSGTENVVDPRSDADQIRVLMHWLYANRDAIHRFERTAHVDEDEFVDIVASQMKEQFLSTSSN
jgi:energy-converting hydrogenase A subunit M